MIPDWKKYAITFAITAAIFGTAMWLSNSINSNRLGELRTIQDSISLNILSSETQFNLLKDAACNDLFSSTIGQELGSLSDKLSYMEAIGRGTDPDVVTLKKYYSLLEIKDYLLLAGASKCPKRPVAILYFYRGDCPLCERQAQVLTYLRQHHSDTLRVYSFDYTLDVSAIKTLANINKVGVPFPDLVIKGKSYNGFNSIEEIQALIPELSASSTEQSKK